MNEQLKQIMNRRRNITESSGSIVSTIRTINTQLILPSTISKLQEINIQHKDQIIQQLSNHQQSKIQHPSCQQKTQQIIQQKNQTISSETTQQHIQPSIITHQQNNIQQNQNPLPQQLQTNNKQSTTNNIDKQQIQEEQTVQQQSQTLHQQHIIQQQDSQNNQQIQQQKQDNFQSIIIQQSHNNQATIRQSYLPQQNQKTFSHALLKTNLAAFFKNYLMNNTNVLMVTDLHIKSIPKNKEKYSFPSMTSKMRPKNYNRALYFDSQSDVIPSFFNNSQTRVSKALAEVHNKKLQDFKRKVKASKIQNGSIVLYDWQTDPMSLNQLRLAIDFIPRNQCWIFLNHAKIKKCLQKLIHMIDCAKDAKNLQSCQKYKKISKQLKQQTKKFFSLPPIERNESRLQIEWIMNMVNNIQFQ